MHSLLMNPLATTCVPPGGPSSPPPPPPPHPYPQHLLTFVRNLWYWCSVAFPPHTTTPTRCLYTPIQPTLTLIFSAHTAPPLQAEDCLRLEEERVDNYLHPSTKPKLLKQVRPNTALEDLPCIDGSDSLIPMGG